MISRENRFGTAKRQKYRIGDIVFVQRLKCEAVILGSINDLGGHSKDTRYYHIKTESGEKLAYLHENEMDLIETLEARQA